MSRKSRRAWGIGFGIFLLALWEGLALLIGKNIFCRDRGMFYAHSGSFGWKSLRFIFQQRWK